MTDVFDAKIMCKRCGIEMKKCVIDKNNVQVRAVKCAKCGDKIIHPADLNCLNHFNDIKDKKFDVKLRMVGNSHTISIPKEIVDFMNEQQSMMQERHKRMRREMDEMVRLAFEDFGRLRIDFFDEIDDENVEEMNRMRKKSRIVGAKEVRVVKNGKNVLHAKQTFDSAHPERSQMNVVRNDDNEEDENDREYEDGEEQEEEYEED